VSIKEVMANQSMITGGVSINTLIKSSLVCFEENTKVTKENGEITKVKKLSEGDMILTSENGKTTYDEVTNSTKIYGKFPAFKFEFSNGNSIIVTSTHLMLVFIGKTFQMIKAKDIKINDVMCFENGLSKISKIDEVILSKKVHVSTKSGIFYANGLLTTGICENLPKNLPESAKDIVKKYMLNYFTENMELPPSVAYDKESKRFIFTHKISLPSCDIM